MNSINKKTMGLVAGIVMFGGVTYGQSVTVDASHTQASKGLYVLQLDKMDVTVQKHLNTLAQSGVYTNMAINPESKQVTIFQAGTTSDKVAEDLRKYIAEKVKTSSDK